MSEEKWFSAKLRFAVMIDPVGGETLNECVFLCKATDFSTAFDRIIEIGEAQEEVYENAEGYRVIWKFAEVVSLDEIPSENLDGAEIYSEPIHLAKESTIPFGTNFNPRKSKPIQTI